MKNNHSPKLVNLRMLEFIAAKLGDICHEFVFLGGCTTALFITDTASPDVRYTLDVDCIVDVLSLNQYHKIEKQLSQRGFTRSPTDSIICRWHYDEMNLDVMPTDPKILGFSNYWYKAAIQNAVPYLLTDQLSIKIVTAPYFLATKFEAFKGRGNNDFLTSHDFEDIISVLDGRPELADEIAKSDNAVKEYLTQAFAELNHNPLFLEALPGHLAPYASLTDERMDIVLDRINKISKII